jgi:CRISPR/Cas system CSM-associated protein Csm3 (group 7 of RAMP superfamily)
VTLKDEKDWRDRFTIHATFKLASSLLIRSGQASGERAPDVVHLQSQHNGKLKPVLSGTSLAGVLRHRAERIVNTLGNDTALIDELFGPDFSNDRSKQAQASRLVVHESIIQGTTEKNELVQNRIAIDRFTGGAYHGALFNEQPIFGSDETYIKLDLELRQNREKKVEHRNAEIGLLLLLLKDLWTEDLPIGGTSSIGRGRLQGKKATLSLYKSQQKEPESWTISQPDKEQPLQFSDSDRLKLETFVEALVNYSVEEVQRE